MSSLPASASELAALPEDATLADYLRINPRTMAVLESFGIRLDPFTIIALGSTPEALAEYSALRDPGELRRALERPG